MSPLEIPPYDEGAACRYGVIRAFLEAKGASIGSMDSIFAAHAHSLNLTVVTSNIREFQRIPGKVEDWIRGRIHSRFSVFGPPLEIAWHRLIFLWRSGQVSA